MSLVEDFKFLKIIHVNPMLRAKKNKNNNTAVHIVIVKPLERPRFLRQLRIIPVPKKKSK